MKKIFKLVLVVLTVCLVVCLFSACGESKLEITGYEIDANNHLIITYADGTTDDLGEIEIPEKSVYTVKFVDINGAEIMSQKVYEGLSAFAPTAPEVKNKVFKGWDKDFSCITADITVKAVYENGQTFTVTFKDINGQVLKTEELYAGESATAPTAPTVAGKFFEKWDKDFTNITGDLVVQAIYREAGSYVVTFKDYNGLSLGTANVKEGNTATAPVTPVRDGYTFKGWSSSLSNVTSSKTVTAEYTLNSGNNIFDISYNVNGNNVTVTLSLAGTVKLAGFEGSLNFEGMNVVSATANSTYALINTSGNSVKITYSNATNVTKGEKVLTVTLTKTADNGKANLTLTDCFDQDFANVTYKVIGQNIKLK